MKSRDLGLLALMATVGFVAVTVLPEGSHAGEMWPTGLAAGVLLLNARSRWAEIGLLVFLASVVAMTFAGRAPLMAGGWSLGITAGALVVAGVLTHRGTRTPRLRDNVDLARFFAAILAGSAVAGAFTGVTSLLLQGDRPGVLAVATVLAHLNGYAVILPFFMAVARHRANSSRIERALQASALAGVMLLVFGLFGDKPLMAFLVVPVLSWCALRNSMRVTLLQLLAFGGSAAGLTLAGIGPFAGVERLSHHFDIVMLALHLFVLACVVSSLPSAVAVAMQRDVSHAASVERDRLHSLVGSTRGIAIIGTDADGLINLFNPGAEQQLGYRAGEVLGKSPSMFHRQEEFERLAELLGTEATHRAVAFVLREPEHAGTEVEFVNKDGDLRMHTMTLARIIDADGNVAGHVSTAEDVTERVQAHTTLTEALETERQAVDRLRQVDQLKDIFVSSVSHELRTPITSILGYLEILGDGGFGPVNSAQTNALTRVAGNSERLLSLIDDLLLLSQVQDGVLETKSADCDLGAVVLAAANVVAPACETTGKAFGIDVPSTPSPFTGDRAQLERAVINLLSNAVKFTQAGGRIDVALRSDADAAIISVRDTGVGIPRDEQAQVFKRFFRSSVAFEMAIQGSGLGLSITQAIAVSHNGHVEFESNPGEGSVFRLVFPQRVYDAHAHGHANAG
ncbi:ATP-binding protein [Nocardioides sp. InS609-2]|uniref:ATP-binding protein n=1 Tax=Nocardioides sp. InS609-2 TaxID=2760705 RepID=UPI0020BE013A|nr:ATP-binding protein [Nocardioides sp. InS609-2]